MASQNGREATIGNLQGVELPPKNARSLNPTPSPTPWWLTTWAYPLNHISLWFVEQGWYRRPINAVVMSQPHAELTAPSQPFNR